MTLLPGAVVHPAEALLTIRKHWFVFFLQGAAALLLAIAPIPLIGILRVYINAEFETQADALLRYGYTLYLMIVWLFFYIAWTNYYLDIWMITKDKIVAVELRGLFHRVIAEYELARVQDITTETKGFFSSLLGYGAIRVETAGERGRFYFRAAPHPEEAKSLILKYHSLAIQKYSHGL